MNKKILYTAVGILSLTMAQSVSAATLFGAGSGVTRIENLLANGSYYTVNFLDN